MQRRTSHSLLKLSASEEVRPGPQSGAVAPLAVTSSSQGQQQLDLNQLSGDRRIDLKLTQEHPDERASRLRREELRLAHEIRTKDVKLYTVTGALILIGLFCLYVLAISTSASLEAQSWARSVLTAIVSGTIGFMAGERTAKKDD